MNRFRYWVASAMAVAACGGGIATATAEGFAGWEGLRVVEQEGYPLRMRSADLDADGDEELILVNFRNARLDIYGWKDAGSTTDKDGLPAVSEDGPANEMPMAPELELVEVPVRQPPIEVAVVNVGSGETTSARLLVLVTDPNLLIEFAPDDEGAWAVSRQWNLLAGRPTGIGHLLHVIPDDQGDSATVLISFNEGIQTLTLDLADSSSSSNAARWLEPRESLGRIDWWLADLDHDGRDDLVEWTNNNTQTLRWYPASPEGFRPAQTLHDRAINLATLLDQADAHDELLVLESSPEGVVRRYRMGEGEASPLGHREPLALPGGDQAVWATLTIEDQTHLVVADPNQPRVTLYAHGPDGWLPGESYPVIGDVEKIVPLTGTIPSDPAWRVGELLGDQPPPRLADNTLLLLAKDAGDLYYTRWDEGRLRFPQPLGLSEDGDESLVIGLGRLGDTTWSIIRTDDDLVLHLWHRFEDDAYASHKTLRFDATAGKAEQARWLGGYKLLVADKFTKGLRLVELNDKRATQIKPRHLEQADLDQFRLVDRGEKAPRIGWQTDGVVQWLGEDLHAIDQVMLPDGRRIADLVLNADGSAWALQQGGTAIHRLVPDDAGLLRVESTTRLDGGGRALFHDDALGLLMQTGQGLTRLAEGRPLELEVVQSLDARAGRPEGVRDATVHRVMSLDVDGDGRDDALLADDIRHQLTAMTLGDDGQLEPLLSWPVFEDIAYPYGGGGDNQVREPRSVVALDLDGDGGQDLALLSHDRLLIYLAREPQALSQAQAQVEPATATETQP
ncbi:MAG: VCBS repeat-containing protein [Planctomycetota bacterium]